MEALNNKEKATKVWQFLGVFASLILLPIALLALSYIKLPSTLWQEDKAKLANYSEYYEQKDKVIKIVKKIDKCLEINKGKVVSPQVVQQATIDLSDAVIKLEELKDSSEFVGSIYNLILNDLKRNADKEALEMANAKADKEVANALRKKQEQQQAAAAAMPAGAMPGGGAMPAGEINSDPNSDYIGAPSQEATSR
jgi:hypothetical protein